MTEVDYAVSLIDASNEFALNNELNEKGFGVRHVDIQLLPKRGF